ncbi:MAG: leucine--tRNA ligase [Proteobacteria bacterium]|nr:leucine--tRNA ligase [Pseudomonadota bacterium]
MRTPLSWSSSAVCLDFRYTAELAGEIETRWQARWEREEAHRQPNPGEPGFVAERPKFYCLDMFPYPSGAGLHVGHPLGYIATDIVSRYKRMRGFNVLHPMGWDAFGLPAEQYAIQTGVHPALTTRKAIDNFRRQLKRFGFSYDWRRELGTIDPDYYRFTQWIFLRIYSAFYDTEQGRARPIDELVGEFERGARPVRPNPDAAEYGDAGRNQDTPSWHSLTPLERKRIVDSWRLAYVGEQLVNWCPKLGTVLANEEVIDGKSERGGFPVVRRPLRQWLFRITAYAERLLEGLDELDWPHATKLKQAAWIGRSEGAEIDFPLTEPIGGRSYVRVYTTRPDTLFGATYLVLAPEHPLVPMLLAAPGPCEQREAIRHYVATARGRSDRERQTDKRKTGVFSGAGAINPATGERIPIWIADYVLMGYGHGAIMAVPGHDERDREFALAFNLPVVRVVQPAGGGRPEGCFVGAGESIASENAEVSLNGLSTSEAKLRIVAWLADRGLGRQRLNYKLRDWLFSRQRYWGEPFPIVFDEQGEHYPVREDALPVLLPDLSDYRPPERDEPRPLLAKARDWLNTTAADAGVAALTPETPVMRETNTMPGWAGSCWYFLRFCDPDNREAPVGRPADDYWLSDTGVDLYIGGAEHAVLHLLYARFWHMVLHDLGHVRSREPFRKLFHQGLITSFAYQRADKSLVPVDEVQETGPDRWIETGTGEPVQQIVAKMSKALKNVINPDDVIAAYGADTFRLYEMYLGPLEASKPWNTRDIGGLFRFLQRAWRLAVDESTGELRLAPVADAATERELHRTVAKVEHDIERLAFNTAIAAIIKFVNFAGAAKGLTRDQLERLVRVLSPFVPHFAEELWAKLGHPPAVGQQAWPSYDEAQLREREIELPVSIMGRVRARIRVPADSDQAAVEAAALSEDAIKQRLEGKTIRRVIVVPGRMVNIVTD